MKISVVINTYNAAAQLSQTLESVKTADEIVVCDMHSNDSTLEIAKDYNCKIVYFEHLGYCEPARNFAIQSASNDWILLLDADEMATPELLNFCKQHMEKVNAEAAVAIPRKNFLHGVFMHASYPNHIIRFFRKDSCNWPPEIHSTPQISGSVYKIPKQQTELAIIHLDDQDIGDRIRKQVHYAEIELIRLKKANRKFHSYQFFTRTFFYFFKFYIIKGGCRDGRMGFLYAWLHAFSRFIVMAKSWESETNHQISS